MNGLSRHLQASSFTSLIRNYGSRINSICRFSSQSDNFSGGRGVPPVSGDTELNTGRNSPSFEPNPSSFNSFSDIKSGLSNKGGNFNFSEPNIPSFSDMRSRLPNSFPSSNPTTFKGFSQMKSGFMNRGGNDQFNAPSTFREERPMRGGRDNFNQSNIGGSGFAAANASTYQNFTRSSSLFKEDVRSGEKSNDMEFVRGVLDEDSGRRPSSVFSHFYKPNLETNADIIHIKMLRNNTFVTVTDSKGNVKCKATSGSLPDLKGGRKSSNYTADATTENIGRRAKAMGLKSVVVKVNGFTHFKKKRKAIIAFRDGFTNSRSDLNPIVYIEDTTRKAHNGCRLPRKRRV